ncbi:filamentous hemagglutinin N-terminal domain-containing protein [Nostoc sp. FACHB-145]|uniref:two-partner secretion domain-containing protein n=1 Tax=Nostoc sp. FACHB-145 TaxID=2692836 RepID=UPI001683C592|nr:filamentous hemagglutinin N-terminal domain-containing protein [Nostoc sp. FACHB-145]MBD2472066.1 filamentous hemagglutinin N-terminal domain-containing protein [Nostoc sp. FACHB-145]
MNRVHQHKKLSLQNFFYLYLISTAFIFASPVQGQIIPDNTLGTEASRLNPNQMIHGVLGDKIDGGARRGSNLFHSFQEFNIETGHRVYIANPAGIANILTRVTGRSPSEIFGTLGVLGNANLYLLNPNGILFGPNAQLDISGSFVANTANSFTFPDGSQFSTTTPKSPPLLNVNVPLGLQYGSSRTGATITNRGDLRSGQDLQLIADKLDLQGQLIAGRDLVLQAQNMVKVRDTALNPFVARSGGNLIIQGNQGIDIFAFSHPQQMAFISGKNLSLLSDGPISGDAHFSSGGDFRIQSLSGHLVNFTSLYDPIISSTGNVDIAAHYSGASLLIESQENVRIQGAVTIDAPDTVSPFVGEDAALRTQPGLIIRSGQNSLVYGGTSQNSPSGFTSGAVPAGITLLSPVRMQPNTQGGLVKLTANQGGITFHSIDASSTTGGNGGTIDLRAAGEIKNTSSFLDPFGLFAALGSFSYTIAGDSGNGGDISLISTLGNITLNNVHSYSYSYSASGNVGSGGNISFSSDSGNITLNNSVLNSNAQSDSDNAGSGGNISFKTGSGDITLNNTPSFSYSYSPSGNAGSGGNISFKTSSGDITLTHSPSNSVSQSNSGHAETGGNISFNASSGDITLNSSPLALYSYSGSGSLLPGGNISLETGLGDITLNNSSSSSSSYGKGNAGDILIKAGGRVLFTNESIIRSTVEVGAIGDAGNINIGADSLLVSNGAQINSDVLGIGKGGNINVNVRNDITIRGKDTAILNSLGRPEYKQSIGEGKAGDINITGGSLRLEDGARIDSGTSGQGNGGNINVNIRDAVVLDGISSQTPTAIKSNVEQFAQGDAGDVTITAKSISITNGALLESRTRGNGYAGNITIMVSDLALFDEGTDYNRFNDPQSGMEYYGSSGVYSSVSRGAIGQGGNITIKANAVSLASDAQINSDVLGIGKGGNINVNVRNDITIRGKDTAILNSLGRPEYKQSIGEGKAGDINITGGSLRLEGGARIDSGTSGQGNGGNINVNIRDAVVLDGISSQTPTAIKSNVEQFAQGDAGDVTITAKSISITNGALLESRTRGNGYAGNITIMVSDLALFDEGTDYNRFNDPQSGMEYYGSSGVYSSVSRGAIGQGGNITIKANAVSLASDAQISSSTSGQGDAGSIAINTPTINFLSNSSKVTASTATSSKGGRISIDQFYPISISGPGQLTVETTGTGKAGDITISADQGIILSNGSQLSALTSSNGGAGSITLNTSALTIAGNAQILATTERDGQGGSITINAPTSVNLMRVQDSAPVLSVETSGAGKAGDITINTPTLRLSEAARITATATESATNLQGGGSITLNTSNLDLAGIVGVFAETQGKSPAGDLRLNPYDNQPDLKVTLTRNSQISASTSGSGQGGDLIVTAPQSITIAGSGKLAVETNSIGNAGNMNFTTRQLILKDGVEISASTSGIGKAGEIGINAETFSLNGGAKISTNTSNSGAAGNLNIQARDQIFLTGQDTGLFASTDEGSTGKGGSIIIDPRTFIIRDGATISTNSQGEGTGGDIKLSAGSLNLDNGKISAATGSSNGGNITLNVQDLLLLRNGSQISTTAGDDQAGGNGGNITVDGKFIVAIPHEDSNISANAFTGTGGNIQINAQGIFGIESRAEPTDQSDITASSEQGISGIINLNTPDNSSIQNSFTQLSPNVIDTNALIANSCIARGTKRQENSFTITGSGALRNSPGDVLISAYTTGDVRSVESTSRPWKKGDPIIEPQGLYRLPDGRLLLSRAC